MTKNVRKTIDEVTQDISQTLKEKNTKVKTLFQQGGKDENGKNKSLKDIENEQII